MKLNKKKILLIPFLVFALLQINYSHSSSELQMSLTGITANAGPNEEGDEDCTDFGARNWDVPTSFQSGYDCLCKERKKTTGECG